MKTECEDVFLRLFERTPELKACRDSIELAYGLMYRSFSRGNKLLACGNGGSAADCEHIVGELMKGFRLPRPLPAEEREKLASRFPGEAAALAERLQRALPAISLVSQTSLATAFANDVAADMVFAQQVYGYGRPGDLLVAISTSGRSANVVNAAKTAMAFDIDTIGLTGENESPLSEVCSVTVRVPARDTHAVQEYHLMVYHALCAMVEAEFFGGS